MAATADIDSCLNWPLGLSPSGYGTTKVNGKTWRAHRLSYATHVGPIPDGAVVRHICDNPACYNPKHLLAGTPKENSADRDFRGNGANGTRVGTSVLTEDQVEAIYFADGATADVARRFGVDWTTADSIRKRKSWVKFLSGFPEIDRGRHAKPDATLSVEAVRAIFVSSLPQAVLARQYGVRQGTISNIKIRKTWGWATDGLEAPPPGKPWEMKRRARSSVHPVP